MKKEKKKDKFFQQFNEEFLEINSEPIVLQTSLGELKFKLKLEHAIGDNLALNELMNITLSFLSNSCKWCFISYKELQKYSSEITEDEFFSFPERKDYNDHVFKDIMIDDQNSKHLFCPGPFHDICHGIVDYFLKYLFSKYYKTIDLGKHFGVLQKNFKLEHGKILFAKNFIISATGSQIQEFFTLYSLYDNIIDRRSEDFKFYTILRNICAFVFSDNSDQFKPEAIATFKNLVRQFHIYYMKNILNPKEENVKTVKFKFHHLQHYFEYLERKKNLSRFDTRRFERKNQQLKRLYVPSNSKINVAKQICIKYSTVMKEKMTHKPEENVDLKERNYESINIKYSRFLDPLVKISELESLDFQRIDIKVDDIFAIANSPNDDTSLLSFIEIKKKYLESNDKFKLIGKKFISADFNKRKIF